MSPSPRRAAVVFTLIAVLLVPQPGHAWGREGHRIVARIATKNLWQATRDKLRGILGLTTDAALENTMATVAIWPDRIDRGATGTAKWHFINVPISTPFSVAGHCANHDCVIDRIDEMRSRLQMNQKGFALLAPPDPPRSMTSQELAFLVHFVGDIHQPLHAAWNGDRGGGCVPLAKPIVHDDGNANTTDLHIAWDIDTVLAAMNRHAGSEQATAAALFKRFKSGATVTQATPVDWARESNEIAKTAIYRRLMIPTYTATSSDCAVGIKPVLITPSYLESNVAIVEQRLMEAGIRLSNVLNEICKGDGCRAIQ
ncbi:MAG TPA: S1/P1 nuclease [Vicinamibacterales bacterium]|nr:S1/P1 nuclease [Vicinamibacterales bacterium]